MVGSNKMDSRLRGNDKGITRDLSVIPAKAGIHVSQADNVKERILSQPRSVGFSGHWMVMNGVMIVDKP